MGTNEVLLTDEDVVVRLEVERGASTKVEFALQLGVTPQYLGDVLAGRRPPAGKILERLGLEFAGKRYREVVK